MELKNFISKTLIEIIDGIKDAQSHAIENQAVIAPQVVVTRKVNTIKFNVAVTTVDGSNAEGGAGIFVGPITIGGRVETGQSSEATSRIEFEIPMYYPEHMAYDIKRTAK